MQKHSNNSYYNFIVLVVAWLKKKYSITKLAADWTTDYRSGKFSGKIFANGLKLRFMMNIFAI